jgi:FMN-dependent NADH-azoreductase
MKLLHINSSEKKHSVSRNTTAGFVEVWQHAYPHGEVIDRDLTTGGLPGITDEFVGAMYTPADKRTEKHNIDLAVSNVLINELKEADLIVIGSPMYNFGISAPLKAWLDLVIRAGETVDFSQRPPKGLLLGKRVVVVTSRGGNYDAGTPAAAFDFQEPYLRHVLGVMGLKDLTFIHVDRQGQGEDIAQQVRIRATKQIEDFVESLTQLAA